MNKTELGDEIARTAALLEAGEYHLLMLIAEFDELGAWAWQGLVSCAHWLSWRIGLDLSSAREKIRVARALRKLPLISKKLEEARISYSKVRALTRVATAENEALLVEIALSTTAAGLEKICRKFRSVLDYERGEPTPEDADVRRTVKYRHLDDSRMQFTVNLPPDEGARFLAAMERAMLHGGADLEMPAPGRLEASPQAPVQKLRKNRADGVMILAESFLNGGANSRAASPACEVQLHVTPSELIERSDGAFIANAGDTGVSAETARRLCCDAALVPVLEDTQGRTLDVGRRTRTIPAALRRALHIRDQNQCRFPGCTHRHFLDGHHIEHWINGGRTELKNLILLCRRHHTFVHEHGYRIELDEGGEPLFIAPNRTVLPRVCTTPPLEDNALEKLADDFASAGLELNELGLLPPYYDAEPIDYIYVVDILSNQTFRPTAQPINTHERRVADPIQIPANMCQPSVFSSDNLLTETRGRPAAD